MYDNELITRNNERILSFFKSIDRIGYSTASRIWSRIANPPSVANAT